MKPKKRTPEQDDLLRRSWLISSTCAMSWGAERLGVLRDRMGGFFRSDRGRPASLPRLVLGLLYLQHPYRLSDEAVVARWIDSPYVQHFWGETFF